jgi:hypothetical protein
MAPCWRRNQRLGGRTNVLSARHANWVQKGFDQFLPALRGFYYDLTQSTSAGTFAALSAIASPDKLLFGSDVPFAGQAQIDITLTAEALFQGRV